MKCAKNMYHLEVGMTTLSKICLWTKHLDSSYLHNHFIFFTATGGLNQSDKDLKQRVAESFKTELPQDFFDFWEFCKKLNEGKPCGVYI